MISDEKKQELLKRQAESINLIQDFDDAINTKGEINKQLKLKTWENKIKQRGSIWDILASK